MVSHPSDPIRPSGAGQASAGGERVARALARAGIASRREAERLIEAGRIALNGKVLTSPAVNVGPGDILTLDGQPVAEREPARLWRYHKPTGLITTHKDPTGRPTVFEHLPPGLPRVISIGRLDLSSEGLLLLTNDGELARQLELPATGLKRIYRVRAFGHTSQDKLDRLKAGITVEGIVYGSIEARLEGGSGANVWISLVLAEGKNREVRRVLEAIGLKVNRLIRVAYGPFELGDLEPGAVAEIPRRQVERLAAGEIPLEIPAHARSAVVATAPRPQRRPAKPKPQASGKAKTEPKAYKPGWARPKPRGPKARRKP